MAEDVIIGKTILELDPLTGLINRDTSFIEVHVTGQAASQKIPLSSAILRGLSAKEVVQITHPEIVTDEQFIAFITGKDGKSAYEIAKAAGFVGTEAQWLVSLKGATGDKGTDGKDGVIGKDGADGKSAYEVAVAQGFQGTAQQWLASLVGPKGDDGKDGTIGKDGEKGDKGDDGKSAYDAAVEAGFAGTEAEWLASLYAHLDQPTLQALLDQFNWTIKKVLRSKDVQGALSANSSWNNFLFLFDKRFDNTENGGTELNLLKNDKPSQKVMEGGFLNAEGRAYFKITDAPESVPDPARPDNPEAVFFLTETGLMGVGSETNHVLIGDGTKIVVMENGVSTTYDLAARAADGKSAYEIAKEEGFQGTEEEWLASLQGKDGPPGKTGVAGNLVGSLSDPSELPDVAEYNQADYFFIGKHIWMNVNGEWTDMGDFEGPPGRDGSGITILGELAGVGNLPAVGERNGDSWLIGKSMWVWNGNRWQEQGQEGLKGEKGEKGDIGPEGKSALDVIRQTYPEVQTTPQMVEFLRGPEGEQGEPAISIIIDGTIATEAGLPVTGTNNHGYLVGNETDGFELHVWVNTAWVNMGNNVGPAGPEGKQGPIGPQGPAGKPMRAKGELASIDLLPTVGNEVGDTYSVAFHFHAWDGAAWIDYGMFRGAQGDRGIQGEVGMPVNPKGELASTDDLPTSGNVQGDAYEIDDYIWVYSDTQFVRMGKWQGLDGKSAYQVAVINGFVGNEAAWLASLKGKDGVVGKDGVDGKSAYQVAIDGGYSGTEVEWLLSLHGKDGISLAFTNDYPTVGDLPAGTLSQVATAAGHIYIHNGTTWVDTGPAATGPKGEKGDTGDNGQDGTNGKSAYEIAVAGGYQGTEAEWIVSLHGAKGDVGKSLYQDAVDRGLFQGTFEQFLASQKGATGNSAFQDAVAKGELPPDATFEDFLAHIQGPEGPRGQTGLTGPAITIIGTLANQAALPASGVAGTGYAIPDASTPGTFDCWIWLTTTNAWFNLGHVVGAKGEKGDQGLRGLQGVKGQPGEKGDQGSLWIVFPRDPQPLDGRVNDYFFNSNTQEFFRKTGDASWSSLGHIGGGNLNKPANDGKTKGMKDGEWIDLALINSIPIAPGQYTLVNGVWKKFDTYTLKALVATNVIDFSLGRVFRIDNTKSDVISLTNIPSADEATTVVVKVYGKVGSYSWVMPAGQPAIRWFDNAVPSFANAITTVVLTWDGREMTGSVPN